MTITLGIIYIVIGVLFCYHFDLMPFKDKGTWYMRSWLMFAFGIIFWIVILIIMFVGVFLEEIKRSNLF